MKLLLDVNVLLDVVLERDPWARPGAELLAALETKQVVDVVPVERQDFYHALSLPIGDFENAVQAAAAFRIDADYLVTRNERDFKGTSIATATPSTVVSLL